MNDWFIMILAGLAGLFVGLAAVCVGFYVNASPAPAKPAAVVRIVDVNGHQVPCITIDHSTTCDWTGFTTKAGG